MRGRKPIPSNVHRLRGNPGKRARNKQEPQPNKGRPSCVLSLNQTAKRHWRYYVKELHDIGTVTKVDRHALAIYCEACARWERAIKMVEEKGEVVKTKQGNIIQNPYVGIANRAADQINKYGASLGLDPSSRTRIKVSPREEKNPFDDF